MLYLPTMASLPCAERSKHHEVGCCEECLYVTARVCASAIAERTSGRLVVLQLAQFICLQLKVVMDGNCLILIC